MELHLGRELGIQTLQKLQKLLVAMAGIALPNDLALRHLQRRKERRRAIALVIMGHGSTATLLQRQSRLGTIQRLNLALFIDTEHQSFLRRVQIKSHHIGQLLQKTGISGKLEPFGPVRLDLVALPNPIDGRFAYALSFGHSPATPVSGPRRLCLERRVHNAFNNFRS